MLSLSHCDGSQLQGCELSYREDQGRGAEGGPWPAATCLSLEVTLPPAEPSHETAAPASAAGEPVGDREPEDPVKHCLGSPPRIISSCRFKLLGLELTCY